MTDEEEERRKRIQRLLDSEAETRAESPVDPKDQPADPNGTTKAQLPRRTPTPPTNIPLDKDNMPLPRRVNETDMEGTRVAPIAYEPTNRPRNGTPVARRLPSQPPLNPPLQPPSQPAARPIPPVSAFGPLSGGCLIRLLIV